MNALYKTLSVLTAGALLLAITPAQAQDLPKGDPSSSSIVGSEHDFSGKSWGSTETCIFCHTPHHSNTGVVPLWNRATTTQATFTLYTSLTLKATPNTPSAVSLACLSCHDGSIAVDSYGSSVGSNKMGTIDSTGQHTIGAAGKLDDSHPISFTYDTALATKDAGLATPVSAYYVDSGNKLPLFNGMVECATCHNPHDKTNGDFLRIDNSQQSALCLACHKK